ncbi:MAG: hypothetical protein IPM38_04155 [Ignavibacteria bacterium]|nr:hypothetical protein [Ignavibacteria bacterium]
MFQEFVEKKIKKESDRLKFTGVISKELISKSDVSDFTKNYLLFYLTDETTSEDISSMVVKSNKLYFNYALRPKWTLINFLFNNFESRSPSEILKKLNLFPFYKYYTEAVSDFINDNSMIFITKAEIENIIDRTNLAIHKKLTVDITGQKIKNVFLQLFIINDFKEDSYNLDSAVPFSFIKIFLADKNYPDLISKFNVLKDTGDEDNVQLKDIIKVLTGKLSADENIPAETPKPEIKENVKPEVVKPEVVKPEVAKPEVVKPEEPTLRKNITEENKDVKETDIGNKDRQNVDETKRHKKEETSVSEGFIIKRKIDTQKTVKNTPAEKPITEEKSESDNYKSDDKTLTITEQTNANTDKLTDSKESIKHKNIDFKELFSEKELDSILNRVYDSNIIYRQRSFEKLNTYKTWFEAFNHLKEIFKNNKVDIYHKDVLKFVDVLNEHFHERE